ncbi:potassium channel family protein [Nocardia inohanensis]|uniref:potassium channel family protein n=1 Tax=Nocardia inohanensis TaxID=209246 RepID=UPI0008316AD9|nr:potassium channel family protein [Nocardia inohanensis]
MPDIDTAPVDTRRTAWERVTAVPLAVLAVLFLGSYAWQVLDHGLHPAFEVWLRRLDVLIWVLFVADYLVRLRLSTARMRFVRRNWLDLVMIAIPPLRPLRLLRAAVLVVDAVDRQTRFQARTRMSVFVGVTSVLLMLLCSLAMYDAERGAPGSTIQNFGDATWWSVVSVTTVGYGDFYPVTVEGRLVALVLLTFGIALISFAIGTTTSWVVEKLKSLDAEAGRTDRELGELVAEIRSLRAEIGELRVERRG